MLIIVPDIVGNADSVAMFDGANAKSKVCQRVSFFFCTYVDLEIPQVQI